MNIDLMTSMQEMFQASEGPCRLLTLCIQYSIMHGGSFGAGLVVLWQSKSRNQTKPEKRGALSNFVAGA